MERFLPLFHANRKAVVASQRFLKLRKEQIERQLSNELGKVAIDAVRSRADTVIRTLTPSPRCPVHARVGDEELMADAQAHVAWVESLRPTAQQIAAETRKLDRLENRIREAFQSMLGPVAEQAVKFTQQEELRYVPRANRSNPAPRQVHSQYDDAKRGRLVAWIEKHAADPDFLIIDIGGVRLGRLVPPSIDTLMQQYFSDRQIQKLLLAERDRRALRQTENTLPKPKESKAPQPAALDTPTIDNGAGRFTGRASSQPAIHGSPLISQPNREEQGADENERARRRKLAIAANLQFPLVKVLSQSLEVSGLTKAIGTLKDVGALGSVPKLPQLPYIATAGEHDFYRAADQNQRIALHSQVIEGHGQPTDRTASLLCTNPSGVEIPPQPSDGSNDAQGRTRRVRGDVVSEVDRAVTGSAQPLSTSARRSEELGLYLTGAAITDTKDLPETPGFVCQARYDGLYYSRNDREEPAFIIRSDRIDVAGNDDEEVLIAAMQMASIVFHRKFALNGSAAARQKALKLAERKHLRQFIDEAGDGHSIGRPASEKGLSSPISNLANAKRNHSHDLRNAIDRIDGAGSTEPSAMRGTSRLAEARSHSAERAEPVPSVPTIPGLVRAKGRITKDGVSPDVAIGNQKDGLGGAPVDHDGRKAANQESANRQPGHGPEPVDRAARESNQSELADSTTAGRSDNSARREPAENAKASNEAAPTLKRLMAKGPSISDGPPIGSGKGRGRD
ncbi:hypothetical protein A9995_07025 [Erythrobacter sp. QSSC1-22B]|uniref:LPD7 domain-containing protein n=1 Tax=Erythrobacter sp. QSSC1-22B TaxID=1860125 RepID=UPI00080580C6|nr:LPD7 domain-containing protein [Erythrobacter sp. QSSC1-22B]OBX19496.1 hypothetical protein A9995_07025 [Erythrobacter sp. QSSC1-22B]